MASYLKNDLEPPHSVSMHWQYVLQDTGPTAGGFSETTDSGKQKAI